ncbi:hypothetical protein CSC2_22020 [Clostridium zeae]|uniref:Uncharacterized protein n=1 Tax=Clostridium zeae TaxID=2759022 RepID=A0ABQ1EAA3_9CLOT|nr:hypothetical protein CSC2_22020 [Clostridium zeae]
MVEICYEGKSSSILESIIINIPYPITLINTPPLKEGCFKFMYIYLRVVYQFRIMYGIGWISFQ